MGRWSYLFAGAVGVAFLLAATPVRESTAEIERLQRQIDELSGKIAAHEERLAASVLEADLQARIEEALRAEPREDEALREAKRLGLLRRFAEARSGLTPQAQRRAAAAVVREARRAGLDPFLVAGVIEVESTYRNFAVSPVGAVGLMQVMPATGAWFSERIGIDRTEREELFDPERNILLGVRYLAELERQFGRMDLALLAYNAGPTRARKIAAGSNLERWLDSYARKVFAAEAKLRARALQSESTTSESALH